MTEGRRIVAMGGRGFSARPGDRELDRYVIEQASVTNPRICLLPTASGDPDDQIQRFYRAFNNLACWPSHISLFRLGERRIDLRACLLGQDIFYVDDRFEAPISCAELQPQSGNGELLSIEEFRAARRLQHG